MIRHHQIKERKKRNLHEKPSSFEDYVTKKEFQKGIPVWLNVYHLTCLNYILQIVGLGIVFFISHSD